MKRVYLPTEWSDRYPVIEYLTAEGLPERIEWNKGTCGPQMWFDFERLRKGITTYDLGAIPSEAQRHAHLLADKLRIGEYIYSLLDVKLQRDVCIDQQSGQLWIVDLTTESVARRSDSNEDESWVQIPFTIEFLNAGCRQFVACAEEFVSTIEIVERKEGEQRATWMQFEGILRQHDATVFSHDLSFWTSVLGEMLGPFD